ncbi:Cna B-type domain-containing protein [Eggerthia catenaformis]|uniref:Cna B-type domain-containing protein n=1 Tax=Eggerthia catenaformis TaxID=31973 RepID=UPI00248DC857|nr:Cna B-type domain-containing protein [Eggerthia catenaformis]
MIPPVRDIKVSKEWKEPNGSSLNAPVDSIEVELYRNGQATGIRRVLTKINHWMAVFEKLPAYKSADNSESYKYTVREVGEKLGKIKLNNEFYTVEVKGSEKDGYITVNKKQQLKLAEVNKPLPKTGDGNKLLVYIALIGLSIIGLIVLKTIKKKDCFSNLR